MMHANFSSVDAYAAESKHYAIADLQCKRKPKNQMKPRIIKKRMAKLRAQK